MEALFGSACLFSWWLIYNCSHNLFHVYHDKGLMGGGTAAKRCEQAVLALEAYCLNRKDLRVE
jgi:hypothetical protein